MALLPGESRRMCWKLSSNKASVCPGQRRLTEEGSPNVRAGLREGDKSSDDMVVFSDGVVCGAWVSASGEQSTRLACAWSPPPPWKGVSDQQGAQRRDGFRVGPAPRPGAGPPLIPTPPSPSVPVTGHDSCQTPLFLKANSLLMNRHQPQTYLYPEHS